MAAPRRATVQGLGHFGGGAGAARFLAMEGWQVTVTDLQTEEQLADSIQTLSDLELRFVLGRHEQADFTDTDLVVANPAVCPGNEHLLAARARGVLVTTEIGMFLERCPARIAAITGTQGKSSTAHFLHELLRAANIPTRLGGNIGGSLLDALPTLRHDEVCVLELSSYQLEHLHETPAHRDSKLELGIITNLREDHLERHGTTDAYHAAKLELLSLINQGAPLLVGAGVVERARSLAAAAAETLDIHETGSLVRIEGGRFTLRGEHLGETSAAAHLPGFQHDNLLLALAAARLLGAPAALLAASLPTLHGLAHRLEDLGQLAERRVYDNGVSTTPDSTQAALRALASDDSPLTLIAGGRAKSLPIDDLLATAAAQARHVVLFGACAESWSARFRDSNSPCEVTTTTTLAEAVRAAWSASAEGDTILFSPAAASFDAYDNFRQRAEDFRACVRSQVRAAAASTTP